MTSPRTRVLFALMAIVALLAALAAVACGGDDDDTGKQQADDGHDHQEFKLGDLTILDPWVRTTTNNVTAAYMTIKSKGAADTLVSVSSPIAGMVQLHEVITEGSSSKMQEKPGGFPVPASGAVELKPGGYHIMLMDLKQQPKEGEKVELTLKFEKAGEIKITAPVKKAAGSGPDMNHNAHGSSSGMGSPTASGGMTSPTAGSGY
jgi:copper(I)-binding protein